MNITTIMSEKRIRLGYFGPKKDIRCVGFQFNHAYINDETFSDMVFYDDEGCNWNPEGTIPCGRLIMVQWNAFLRRIKRYVEIKKEMRRSKARDFMTEITPLPDEILIYIVNMC